MEKQRTKRGTTPYGKGIRPVKRLAIYLRDDFQCVYCWKSLNPSTDPRDCTLDHIKPKSKGGTNDDRNLVTCCRSCKRSRQDKSVSSFATATALQRINKVRRRSLDKYLRLAFALRSKNKEDSENA